MKNNEDLAQLGSGGTAMPRYDLNLAGSEGVPTPEQIVQPSLWSALIPPDFSKPDFSMPTLKGNDLTGVNIDVVSSFAPDPSLPDLRNIPRPSAVDMPDGMQAAPDVAQDIPDDAEIEGSLYPGLGFSGLTVNRDVYSPDPAIPDLQHPDLRPQVSMPSNERPGDLDPNALDVMHNSLQYEQVRNKEYPAVQMDQYGMNNHRSRDYTLLMKGLDDERR